MKRIVIVFVILVTSVPHVFPQQSPTLENIQTEINQLINSAKYSVVTVYAKVSHSYVVDKDAGVLSLFKNNTEEKKDEYWNVGSGIIYNQDGYIITRSSLLADFEEIKISLCEGTEFSADYIGTDQQTGLAILKIDEKKLESSRIGNSDRISMYSMIMVLGNSMGISPFASFGLINGITKDGNFVLSAQIIPGNIGGAVFNLTGEIIGIIAAQLDANESITSPTNLYTQQNGLAIPINKVAKIVDDVIQLKHDKKNWLGIVLDPDLLTKNKLIVKEVIPRSPAARVGLKKGDQLIKYNETDLSNIEILSDLIKQTKTGTSVSINFIRHNRTLKVFPRIERKWPFGFNQNKPRQLSPNLMNESMKAPIQSPIIISPEKFQQINSRMIEMESEIRSLKTQIKK